MLLIDFYLIFTNVKEELNIYIDYFLRWENPIIYAIIIAGSIVLMSYIFYFHMFLPQKKQIHKERIESELKNSKLMMERFRSLSLQLQEKLEMEKQRLGRELHDSIGQNLLLLKLKVTNGLDFQDPDIINIIDSTITDLREITLDLRPRVLQDLGLPTAVINLSEQVKKNSTITGSVDIAGAIKELNNQTELYLYRVIQECMNNILKHSGANEFHIQLSYNNKDLSIIIYDDGNGFDFHQISQLKGSGLLNIEERIKSMGGNLKISSNNEEGTIISMEVPYG